MAKEKASKKKARVKHAESCATRPPIVVVLGHIDHGKTTLLDYIRKTRVAAKEAGGITQSIGAYQVEIRGVGASKPTAKNQFPPEAGPLLAETNQPIPARGGSAFGGNQSTRRITFIDTPGHAAFAKMRSRGAAVADIAILVVAANDGVMPQTKEAIAHAKAAKIPIVVALNKIDLADVDPQKVKGQLAKEGVIPEDQGGDVPVVPVSAKTGKGVDELLEMVGLVADLLELKSEPDAPLEAVVIESTLSSQQGPTATVVVKKGTLKVGEEIVAGAAAGKVKALINDRGGRVKEAKPGTPVEILGFSEVPSVGALISAGTTEPGNLSTEPISQSTNQLINQSTNLNVILRADTQGSLEAIGAALGSIKVEGRGISILLSGVGQITDSDIYLAQSANGVVLGFNVDTSPSAKKLAADLGVGTRSFTIIYELLDMAEKLLQGAGELEKAKAKGEGEVIKIFTLHSGDVVLGVRITAGKIKYHDRVKVFRREEEIHQGKVRGLKIGTEEVAVAKEGKEVGVLIKPQFEFVKGDKIVVV